MTMISLFVVGTGTFLSQEYLQPSFALSKPGINAGTWASRKFLYKTLSKTSYL